MNILLLLVGSLLVAFGGRTALAQNYMDMPSWMPKIQQNFHSPSKLGFNDGGEEWKTIRQQCARKGFSPINLMGKLGSTLVGINGVKHYYEQSVDPKTGRIQGRYYSYNSNNPNAEPLCGRLVCPICN